MFRTLLLLRFGMPSQTPINSKMTGVGSCGIGVIMAAKDFILKGPLVIQSKRRTYVLGLMACCYLKAEPNFFSIIILQ